MSPTTPSSPSLRPAGANSTYAVSEEPMDVEEERAVAERDQLDSAGITEVSFILPPSGPSAR